MKREAIKKPVFLKLFAVRFIIFLMVFLTAASALLYGYNHEIESTKQFYRCYLSAIGKRAAELYASEPGSEEYNKILSEIKLKIAIYQMVEHNYVEVHMGQDVITVPDTAYMFVPEEEQRIFFIEDMTYLAPLIEYDNGRFNPQKHNEWAGKNQYELIYRFVSDAIRNNDQGLFDRQINIKDAYINRKTHTFIPGKVRITDFGKEYIVDCTPEDTKGYEKFEPGWTWDSLLICYRLDAGLTSKDVNSYIIPDAKGEPVGITELSFFEDGFNKSTPWYVAYREDFIAHSVFETAPVTSNCIVVTAVVLAGLVAFILANIRYHKDNTVWKVFLYRTKVAEAMAHDLKTPLAAIGAYAESMESFPGDASKTAEYTAKITEKVAVMDHMIEDILALSKGGTGKMKISAEEVSVLSLLKESLEAFPEMKTEIKGDDVTLKTDRKLLEQAIGNLLSNCDRYGEKGSAVTISLAPSSLTIANKTADSFDDVESLKKPFVKGSGSRNDKGTGLGLSIADNNLNILGYKLELSFSDGVFTARVKFK